MPNSGSAFASAQAAWRFYANPATMLPTLARPLIDAARDALRLEAAGVALVALDWTRLDYGDHASKKDRVALQNKHDLGYKLLTALCLSDRSGAPLAPVCMELKAADGLHSTRHDKVVRAPSALDGLAPVMAHVTAMKLGVPPVFIVDREADSVLHFRAWNDAGHRFVVRADSEPKVTHAGESKALKQAAAEVGLKFRRDVEIDRVPARQYVGETTVVLERAASPHRTTRGKRVKQRIAGKALELRLVVSELRDEQGRVLSRWLLLTNLPPDVDAAIIALWYYWRWRIETYHKLLKSSGQQVQRWQQDDADTLAKRLLVSAMACVVVWRLAREASTEASQLRHLLVRLSGRQMDRSRNTRGYTEPALLAGLERLLPMLALLEEIPLKKLRELARSVLPADWFPATG